MYSFFVYMQWYILSDPVPQTFVAVDDHISLFGHLSTAFSSEVSMLFKVEIKIKSTITQNILTWMSEKNKRTVSKEH